MMDYRENLQKFHEYIRALEEERRKVEMFQRELPLCLEIVTQAIESYKQQLAGRSTAAAATTTTTTTSQGSEQTTSECPVFEEFIPLKRTCSSTRENEEDEDDDDELGSHKNSADFEDCDGKSGPEKKDWLSSVQLWNQSPDPPSTTTNELPKKVAVVEVMRNGGAFHPFQKEEDKCTISNSAAVPPPPAPTVSACSTAERGGRGGGEKKEEGGKQRKSRRCWSPELHKRFLNALDQLGGSHAATPKQIRDLMKVDGLTNDEVKSHLQKYRLHSRRPPPTSSVHNNGTLRSPAPQLVVVGGIWMPPPPPEYTPAGIYCPVPPSPLAGQLHQQRQHQNQSSQSEGSSPGQGQGVAATRCNSPATPSSIHTATASPAY